MHSLVDYAWIGETLMCEEIAIHGQLLPSANEVVER